MVETASPGDTPPPGDPLGTDPAQVSRWYGSAARPDEMFPISTARVVLVDHDRLLADFPQLREDAVLQRNPHLLRVHGSARAALLRRITQEWLVRCAALVSQAQLGSDEANTVIHTAGPSRRAVRPPLYGRACIVAVPPASFRVEGFDVDVVVPGGGELDLKGVGVGPGRSPYREHHSHGLISLQEGLREYLIERVLDTILRHDGSAVRTLPHYGLIDTGFDGFTDIEGTADREQFPAGIVIRRAHLRDLQSDLPLGGSPDQYLTINLEMLLRRYGLTSSQRDAFTIKVHGERLMAFLGRTPTRDSPALISLLVEHLDLELPFVADVVNIQLDAPAGGQSARQSARESARQIVDFGQYGARDRFDRALVSLVNGAPMGWGGMVLQSDVGYTQPDPALIPAGQWWAEASGQPMRLFDGLCAGLVRAFRQGDLDPAGLRATVDALIEEHAAQLRQVAVQ